MNKNYNITVNVNYKKQQQIIKDICSELNLVVFYPNYHADKNDNNTVLIYTKSAHEYNKSLPYWRENETKQYICHFENSDINGRFDFNFMNRGKNKSMYKIKRLANKRYFLINLEFGFNQTITIKGIEYKYTLEQRDYVLIYGQGMEQII
jgi:hypothetical protein